MYSLLLKGTHALIDSNLPSPLRNRGLAYSRHRLHVQWWWQDWGGGGPIVEHLECPLQGTVSLQTPLECPWASSALPMLLGYSPSHHAAETALVIACKGGAVKNSSICISCMALHLEISFIWQLLQSELNLEGGPGRFMLASPSLQ